MKHSCTVPVFMYASILLVIAMGIGGFQGKSIWYQIPAQEPSLYTLDTVEDYKIVTIGNTPCVSMVLTSVCKLPSMNSPWCAIYKLDN